MRKKFIQAEKREHAIKRAPWAAYLIKGFGGYWAFESYDDYKLHLNQK